MLRSLDLSSNHLSGTLHEDLVKMSREGLSLSNNNISGSLPAAYITNVTSSLDVSNNRLSCMLPQISLSITSSARPSILLLYIQNNQFVGCLPHSWVALLSLSTYGGLDPGVGPGLGFRGWGNCLNVNCSTLEDLVWWRARTTSLTPQWKNCTVPRQSQSGSFTFSSSFKSGSFDTTLSLCRPPPSSMARPQAAEQRGTHTPPPQSSQCRRPLHCCSLLNLPLPPLRTPPPLPPPCSVKRLTLRNSLNPSALTLNNRSSPSLLNDAIFVMRNDVLHQLPLLTHK